MQKNPHVIWKIEIISEIVSKVFDISFIYNSLDMVSERIISLEFSSYKRFFTPHVKIVLERNG